MLRRQYRTRHVRAQVSNRQRTRLHRQQGVDGAGNAGKALFDVGDNDFWVHAAG